MTPLSNITERLHERLVLFYRYNFPLASQQHTNRPAWNIILDISTQFATVIIVLAPLYEIFFGDLFLEPLFILEHMVLCAIAPRLVYTFVDHEDLVEVGQDHPLTVELTGFILLCLLGWISRFPIPLKKHVYSTEMRDWLFEWPQLLNENNSDADAGTTVDSVSHSE